MVLGLNGTFLTDTRFAAVVFALGGVVCGD